MGLLHRDEPVSDATVNCPSCGALEWVIRRPRLGGDASIVCRACGHVDGPYFEIPAVAEAPEKRGLTPFFVPEGHGWEPGHGWERSFTVLGDVTVTTERDPPDPAEALRDAVADLLASEERPPGRSHAAYLLELSREDARIEAIVEDLHVEAGTLQVDGAELPAKVMRHGDAWAAHALAGGVAVTASSRVVAQVSLVTASR
jgi:hypothetical protein